MSDTNTIDGIRIIPALDTPAEQAEKLVIQLAPHVAGFKVGFRQITAATAPRLLAGQAVLDGSSYLVVGRPIYEPENPISAVLALNAEVEQALVDIQKGVTL